MKIYTDVPVIVSNLEHDKINLNQEKGHKAIDNHVIYFIKKF